MGACKSATTTDEIRPSSLALRCNIALLLAKLQEWDQRQPRFQCQYRFLPNGSGPIEPFHQRDLGAFSCSSHSQD